jgi:hypothetical protein
MITADVCLATCGSYITRARDATFPRWLGRVFLAAPPFGELFSFCSLSYPQETTRAPEVSNENPQAITAKIVVRTASHQWHAVAEAAHASRGSVR